LTDPETYQPEENPVSVFMAGSPGAGKTEASKALIADLQPEGSEILRIDPDDLREEFEDYTGGNSYLFQRAVSILVEKLHDFALKQKQSFLLDGTLSNHEIAEKNIGRSLDKKRFVQILYVYQEPALAWRFVVAREKLEGRRIPPEQFVEQYFAARDVVNSLKALFEKKIQVDLLLKNVDGSNRVYRANIDEIDNFEPEKYTRSEVESIIRTL
jgi:UDP-N-acetylglucosamine kinase